MTKPFDGHKLRRTGQLISEDPPRWRCKEKHADGSACLQVFTVEEAARRHLRKMHPSDIRRKDEEEEQDEEMVDRDEEQSNHESVADEGNVDHRRHSSREASQTGAPEVPRFSLPSFRPSGNFATPPSSSAAAEKHHVRRSSADSEALPQLPEYAVEDDTSAETFPNETLRTEHRETLFKLEEADKSLCIRNASVKRKRDEKEDALQKLRAEYEAGKQRIIDSFQPILMDLEAEVRKAKDLQAFYQHRVRCDEAFMKTPAPREEQQMETETNI